MNLIIQQFIIIYSVRINKHAPNKQYPVEILVESNDLYGCSFVFTLVDYTRTSRDILELYMCWIKIPRYTTDDIHGGTPIEKDEVDGWGRWMR